MIQTTRLVKALRYNRIFIFSLLYIFTTNLYIYSQEFKGAVHNAETNDIVAYASIYNTTSKKGTITDDEGKFTLNNSNIGDTVLISIIGFEPTKVIVDNYGSLNRIGLKPLSILLSEITVTSDNGYLYNILSKIKKKSCQSEHKAKSYLILKTEYDNKIIEAIEVYFNAVLDNYIITDLEYKKGRIAANTFDKRVFSTTEASKIFLLYDLFEKMEGFPINPLSGTKAFLRKKFDLSLVAKYSKNENDIIEIDFTPLDSSSNHFSGRIWINLSKNLLEKITLSVKNTNRHPFVMIGQNKIDRIDLKISKTFKHINECILPELTNIKYTVNYTDNDSNKIQITSEADLITYNYRENFIIPEYIFSNSLHEDYRRIMATPYDSMFWLENDEFRINNYNDKATEFMTRNVVKKLHPDSLESRYSHPANRLQFPYILWDNNRISMDEPKQEILEALSVNSTFESNRYEFNLQFYLDRNTYSDTIINNIYSIFDPVSSFYHFNIDNRDLAFINMNFDLLEIQRQEFIKELQNISSCSDEYVIELYRKHTSLLNSKLKKFRTEVNRGKNRRKFEKWNSHIYEKLNVNNLVFFNIIKS